MFLPSPVDRHMRCAPSSVRAYAETVLCIIEVWQVPNISLHTEGTLRGELSKWPGLSFQLFLDYSKRQ